MLCSVLAEEHFRMVVLLLLLLAGGGNGGWSCFVQLLLVLGLVALQLAAVP